MPKLAAFALVLVATLGLPCDGANQWGVVGAGNASCAQWKRMDPMQRQEVLSWMAGFSTAVSIELATEGKPVPMLELLTYEYLERVTTEHCLKDDGGSKSMFAVLLDVLTGFPRRS
jgi:hypothetical protein